MSGTPPSDLTPPGPPPEEAGQPQAARPREPDPSTAPPSSGASYSSTATPSPTDSGFGWTAFGLAWVVCIPCLPLASSVLAVVALVRKRFRPRWVAVVALLLGLAGTGLQIAVAANPDFWDRFDGPDTDSAEDDEDDRGRNAISVATAKLRVGDCFDDPQLRNLDPDGSTNTVAVTVHPCSELHDYEVFAAFPIRAKDFPGQSAVELVVQRCFPALRTFVGQPYAQSDFEVYYYGPTAQSWRLIGDKTVSCLIGHPKHQVRGTLEGVRR